MAEAKERNLTPAIPSDMQSLMKRCENLEKEVRSLKLNLAFMNRYVRTQKLRNDSPETCNTFIITYNFRGSTLVSWKKYFSFSDNICPCFQACLLLCSYQLCEPISRFLFTSVML